LTKRHIAHTTLTRTLDSKTIYTIPQLLKTVKSPDYAPPNVENDFVVMGIIASQSAPLATKNAQHTAKSESDCSTAGKFMVIRLTDLKWELDLFLFDTGFARFYKLTPGTLVAILNPEIMPPRHKDTGKFSLKLTSSDDTVLEIGIARDLRYCSAMRKDGKECGQWIDGRKTEVCDFHIELQVEKARRGRMEVNTMSGFGKGKEAGHGRGRGGKAKKDDRFGRYHDNFLHETMYIAPGAGAAASLLDDDGAFEKGASRAELHRKRLAEKEKERELAKKLGEMGRGTGSEYMKAKGTKKELPSQSSVNELLSTTESDTIAPSTAAQILLGKKAQDVSLSPVKRKRTISNKPKEPVGWGGAFKRGLLLPDEKRETSPSKKKARFMLEDKGIREPGRESLGGLDVGLVAAMDEDDDDDGLDII
jgi:minichromosome maintenance protein 10